MKDYFGMDSFSREATETAYCVNNIRSKENDILLQSSAISPIKYVSMDGLITYHNLSQEQIKKLENRVAALEEKIFKFSSALVNKNKLQRLKRADLNLVFK